jgi:thioredoxin-related protein
MTASPRARHLTRGQSNSAAMVEIDATIADGRSVAQSYRVRGYPTVVLFKDFGRICRGRVCH